MRCCYICSPTGPYFPTPKTINLLAISETVRSWPGGTGGHKLGLDYSPGFTVLRNAVEDGYDHWQILWLLPDGKEMKFTEAGAMNFFVAANRDDDGASFGSQMYIVVRPVFYVSFRFGYHPASRWNHPPWSDSYVLPFAPTRPRRIKTSLPQH